MYCYYSARACTTILFFECELATLVVAPVIKCRNIQLKYLKGAQGWRRLKVGYITSRTCEYWAGTGNVYDMGMFGYDPTQIPRYGGITGIPAPNYPAGRKGIQDTRRVPHANTKLKMTPSGTSIHSRRAPENPVSMGTTHHKDPVTVVYPSNDLPTYSALLELQQ